MDTSFLESRRQPPVTTKVGAIRGGEKGDGEEVLRRAHFPVAYVTRGEISGRTERLAQALNRAGG